MKPIFQIENYSCWPVAILNTLKLFKIKHNETENSLILKTWSKPIVWSENEDLIKTINKDLKKFIKIEKTKENWSIEEIKEELKKGNLVLVNYINAFSGGWNYSVIYKSDKKSFYFKDSTLWNLRLPFHMFENNWFNSKKTIQWFFISISKK